WDPAVLRIGVEESVGLRQQRLLAVDERGMRSVDSVRAQAAWQEERTAVRAVAGRPHGPRFCTLVHALLAVVPLGAEPAAVASLAALEGRVLGASDEEVRAAA